MTEAAQLVSPLGHPMARVAVVSAVIWKRLAGFTPGHDAKMAAPGVEPAAPSAAASAAMNELRNAAALAASNESATGAQLLCIRRPVGGGDGAADTGGGIGAGATPVTVGSVIPGGMGKAAVNVVTGVPTTSLPATLMDANRLTLAVRSAVNVLSRSVLHVGLVTSATDASVVAVSRRAMGGGGEGGGGMRVAAARGRAGAATAAAATAAGE